MTPADDPHFGTGYAVAAYVVIFVVFYAYVAWLHVSHRRLAKRLAAMERRLEQRDGEPRRRPR